MALNRQRFLVAEVIQTSAIDCGPASLKALLDGFHIPTSYGRLREACQTDVDGTSIDTIEVVAEQLGLDARQILIPLDHVLLNEASTLPAIAVVRGANGTAHFIVAWRRHGGARPRFVGGGHGRFRTGRRRNRDRLLQHRRREPRGHHGAGGEVPPGLKRSNLQVRAMSGAAGTLGSGGYRLPRHPRGA